jgi:membrane-bound ClpP family serine protease
VRWAILFLQLLGIVLLFVGAFTVHVGFGVMLAGFACLGAGLLLEREEGR